MTSSHQSNRPYQRPWRSTATIIIRQMERKAPATKRSGTSGAISRLCDSRGQTAKLDTLRRRMEYSQKIDLKNRVMLKATRAASAKPVAGKLAIVEARPPTPVIEFSNFDACEHSNNGSCKSFGTAVSASTTPGFGLPPRVPRRRTQSYLRSAYPPTDVGVQSKIYYRRARTMALKQGPGRCCCPAPGNSDSRGLCPEDRTATPTRILDSGGDKMTIEDKIRHLIQLHEENFEILENRVKQCP